MSLNINPCFKVKIFSNSKNVVKVFSYIERFQYMKNGSRISSVNKFYNR